MVRVATTNDRTFEELKDQLGNLGNLTQIPYDYTRIESPSLKTIATVAAIETFDATSPDDIHANRSTVTADLPNWIQSPNSIPSIEEQQDISKSDSPVIVAVDGLFIDELEGLPGTATHQIEQKLSEEEIWNILNSLGINGGRFRTGIAYAGTDQVVSFGGESAGSIVEPRGSKESGVGRLFEVNGDTFAEMRVEQKNINSSLGRAATRLADWIVGSSEGGSSISLDDI